MQSLDDDERKAILGEVLLDELKAIRGGISNLPTRPEFNELKADVEELKADVKVIKAVVTDHSKQIQKHDTLLNSFGSKAA